LFIAAGVFGRSYWALPISNFGEILITLALIATALHFAPARSSQQS
jgi:ABC-type transport system involved in cytochrome c biogenesis permease subunit